VKLTQHTALACGKKKKDVKEKLDAAVRRKLGTRGWRDA
jgi:hypothetical protein